MLTKEERRALSYCAVIIVACALLLVWVNKATAHEWYPYECCSDNDCAPIALSETPREENGGFTLIDGRHIAYKDVRVSPDGQWHLCETKWELNPAERRIICVYAPIGGV